MSDRITIKHLEGVAQRINKLTNSPMSYRDEAGKILPGHFHISRAYGGFNFVQTVNEGGGERTLFSYGHIPARALFDQMKAFEAGLEYHA